MTIQGFAREPISGSPKGLHRTVNLWRDDNWSLAGKLFDAFINPLNLTGAAITWSLIDRQNNILRTLTLGSGITIVGSPSAGQILITIADNPTIPHGHYYDRLQVTLGGVTETYWVGSVRVHDHMLLVDDLNLAGLSQPDLWSG